MMETWKKAASAKNSFDLELKQSLLEANGIRIKASSETINKLYGLSHVPFQSGTLEDPLGVYVQAHQYEAAIELLDAIPETESSIIDRTVLLDRNHQALCIDGAIPSHPVDDHVDMTDFVYLDEFESPTGRFRFFLTGKEWESIPLPNGFSCIESPKLFQKDLQLQEAYFACLLEGWIPQSPIFEIFGFADTPKAATELGALVVAGRKTGTSGLLWSYEAENEPLPENGNISIVLDGKGNPLCAIQDDSVTILPFSAITQEHAKFEGEGDLSLSYWTKVHTKFFLPYCNELGKELDPDTPIVYEKFHVIRLFGKPRG